MTAGLTDRQACDWVTDGASRRHFVHVYAVIRVKVAVDAPDHAAAMQAADGILFGDGLPSGLLRRPAPSWMSSPPKR